VEIINDFNWRCVDDVLINSHTLICIVLFNYTHTDIKYNTQCDSYITGTACIVFLLLSYRMNIVTQIR
jgi:hypothetical protein